MPSTPHSHYPSLRPVCLRSGLGWGVALAAPLHPFVGPSQHPELTGKVAAFGEVRLVVVWAPIENVQAHAWAAKNRGQADGISTLSYHNIPELPREVGTIDKVRLVVVWAPIENVQAHISTTKLR